MLSELRVDRKKSGFIIIQYIPYVEWIAIMLGVLIGFFVAHWMNRWFFILQCFGALYWLLIYCRISQVAIDKTRKEIVVSHKSLISYHVASYSFDQISDCIFLSSGNRRSLTPHLCLVSQEKVELFKSGMSTYELNFVHKIFKEWVLSK
jgi:hypothetical protein